MPEFTIGTFNVENLFTRYKFRGKRVAYTENGERKYRYEPYTPEELLAAVERGFILDRNLFQRLLEDSRVLTAKAIRALDANIIGLQEVENLDTLKLFNTGYLKGSAKFDFPLLIDGNDPRFIDVAVLSRLPIDFVRTHQFVRSGKSTVFSRDCLEVHVKVGSRTLPIFVNHLKSMMGGRAKTRKRREAQCQALLEILKDRFGSEFGKEEFVLVGDLNDYLEEGKEKESGLRALLQSDQMENVVLRLPPEERWTHYYAKEKSYHQLDYILLSKALAAKNPDALPVIERRGQPLRVNQPGQPPKVRKFFPEVKGKLKASDHCPVAITLRV
jgi:endonuclease/exonuclease/phosphatase family metal-dependent hydrolase